MIERRHIEAEQAILGCVFFDNSILDDLVSKLGEDAEAFTVQSHKALYEIILALHRQSKPVDIVTVQNAANVDAIGGLDNLLTITGSVPSSGSFRHYAQTVADAHTGRRIAQLVALTQQRITKGDPVSEILEAAEIGIMGIASQNTGAGSVPISTALPGAIAMIEALVASENKPSGAMSGLPDLDKLKHGFRGGELIIIGARPAVGKTAFALNIAHHCATRQNLPVLFCSLEMSSEELTGRLIGIDGGANLERIRGGWQGRPELEKARRAAKRLDSAKIDIIDNPRTGISEIRSLARRHAQKRGKGILILDYLQLMRVQGNVQRYEALGEISRGLKQLARELSIPVVALAQLGRGAEDATSGYAMMRHLRESGNLEADADAVIALRRPSDKEAEEIQKSGGNSDETIEITLCKNRSGQTGSFFAHFEKCTQRIRPLEHHEAEAEPEAETTPPDYENGDKFDEFCEEEEPNHLF